MRERRRFLRITCELESSFRHLDGEPPPPSFVAAVLDISRGGLRMRVNHSIPFCGRLRCRLLLPGYPEIVVEAVPAWIVSLPHFECFDVGVRFVNLSPEAQETIRNYEYEILLKKGMID